jgi:ribosomal protein L11 methyltransferase
VIRLAIRVRREQADAALAALLGLSPAGLEEVDVDAQTIEYALYGAPAELPSLSDLEAALGAELIAVQTSEIADDWPERWRDFHQPSVVAGRLYVRPPWHPPRSEPGLIDVAIEPAQAFGTGSHATTRMCLELMVGLERAGDATGALLDVGCGSGVLAIAAAKLGFAPVEAIDHDPLSVEATRTNAAANGVRVAVREADLARQRLPFAQTLVANLLLAPLLELSRQLERPPERLIASGLLDVQGDEFADELRERHALQERARERDGDWLAMLFARADPRVSS